jgi:SHS2 domain-containing protein
MGKSNYSWEPAPHTADLAISISSSDETGLFRAAFEGLLGIQGISTDPADVASQTEYNLEISVDEIENALVDFLNECIYVVEVEEEIPYAIKKINYDGKILAANLRCRPIRKDERRELGHVKAATYSDLKVIETDGVFGARIVFDT